MLLARFDHVIRDTNAIIIQLQQENTLSFGLWNHDRLEQESVLFRFFESLRDMEWNAPKIYRCTYTHTRHSIIIYQFKIERTHLTLIPYHNKR